MSHLPPTIQALKEGFQFLGSKLDALISSKNQVNIDVSKEFSDGVSQAIADGMSRKDLNVSAQVDLSPITTGLNSLATAFAKRDDKAVVDAISALKKSIDSIEIILPENDNSDVIKALKELGKKVDKIPVAKVPDYSKELADISKKVDKLAGALKIDIPKEITLQKRQFDQMIGSMGGAIGTPSVATRVTLVDVDMASANTEYSYTFPAGTVQWRMKLRAHANAWFYSWETGQLPGSGDDTEYISIPEMWLDSRDGVSYAGKTIYFESATASQTMEIEVGQA